MGVAQSMQVRPRVNVVLSVGDVILMRFENDGLRAGELWQNFELDGETICLVTVWEMEAQEDRVATWRCTNDTQIVLMEALLESLVWTRYSEELVKTILPI